MPRAPLALGCDFFAALPPPRLRLVPPGFAPELRRSPCRLPAFFADVFGFAFAFFIEIEDMDYLFLLLFEDFPPLFFALAFLPLLFLLAAFLPPLLELLVLLFFPRPEPPGFLPPLSCLLTVRQARSFASSFETQRFL